MAQLTFLSYFVIYFLYMSSLCHSQEVQESQYLVFHDSSDCNATFTSTFNQKVVNTQGSFRPPGVNISSALVNGMWKIRICPSTGGPCAEYLEHSFFTQTCLTFPPASDTISYTRYGDSNQNHSEVLYLFTNDNFTGSMTEIHSEVGVKELNAKSFYFTGFANSWSMYEDPLYNGEMTCLESSEAVKENGYGFTYSWSTEIKGMSARISQCTNVNDNATTTTTTSTTSIMTSVSTTELLTSHLPTESSTSISETIPPDSTTDPPTTLSSSTSYVTSECPICSTTSSLTDMTSTSTSTTEDIINATKSTTPSAARGAAYVIRNKLEVLLMMILIVIGCIM